MSARAALAAKPARVLASVSSWMRRSVEAGVPITGDMVLSWAAAFDAAAKRAEEIEGRPDPADRVDAAFADLLVFEGSNAVRALAELAGESATRGELIFIEQTSLGLVSALEALAHGVARPVSNTLKGA